MRLHYPYCFLIFFQKNICFFIKSLKLTVTIKAPKQRRRFFGNTVYCRRLNRNGGKRCPNIY
ncbi:hypothetical protein HMPREF1548_02719 [Clostridium sp. KLE 1755]|nr:hypothetical protein HMPREF1548_02719 [Clostridium sp. KLE 1755]